MPENVVSEREVCTKLITPALERAGWDVQTQVREEVSLTAGKVLVRGKLVARGKAKRADYVLYLKPGLPLAVVEAKEPGHSVGDGMQQRFDSPKQARVGTSNRCAAHARLTSTRPGPSISC
jgi:type I restriction enzyme R subunit